jgi:hypothetical protein
MTLRSFADPEADPEAKNKEYSLGHIGLSRKSRKTMLTPVGTRHFNRCLLLWAASVQVLALL